MESEEAFNEGLLENPGGSNAECPTVISRNYLTVLGQVTRDHTIKVYGDKAHGKSETDIEKWRASLDAERKSARSWANCQVTKKMLEEAERQGLQVSSMSELHRAWKEDDSDEMGKKMWEVAYGAFDRHGYWATDYEDDYMKMMNWTYGPKADNTSNKTVSCLSSLFSHVKNDVVKCINRAVSIQRGGHGRAVRVARKKSEIDESNMHHRRRKGVFHDWMLTGSPRNKRSKKSPKKSPKQSPKKTSTTAATNATTDTLTNTPTNRTIQNDIDISPMSFTVDEFNLPGINVDEDKKDDTPKTKKMKLLEKKIRSQEAELQKTLQLVRTEAKTNQNIKIASVGKAKKGKNQNQQNRKRKQLEAIEESSESVPIKIPCLHDDDTISSCESASILETEQSEETETVVDEPPDIKKGRPKKAKRSQPPKKKLKETTSAAKKPINKKATAAKGKPTLDTAEYVDSILSHRMVKKKAELRVSFDNGYEMWGDAALLAKDCGKTMVRKYFKNNSLYIKQPWLSIYNSSTK